MDKKNIFLLSDSTGDTINSILRSTLVQFDSKDVKENNFSFIKTKEQIYKILVKASDYDSLVLYTLMNKDLENYLIQESEKLGIKVVSVLARVTRELSYFLKQKAAFASGIQHELDDEYFYKVEAINYALTHDDGRLVWDLDKAEIVLIGVSRTSKSPTSLHLAFKGYLTANIPFINSESFPVSVDDIKKKSFVVALTINPKRLIDVRKNRLIRIGNTDNHDYVDLDKVKAEMIDFRRFISKHNCRTIDVTRKSIEETTVEIVQLYKKWKKDNV